MSEISDFKKFLESASPEDFDRSSAIEIIGKSYQGMHGFERFIEERLTAAQDAFNTSEGHINPWVSLANTGEERIFEAYHDESVSDMFSRLHREARAMNAIMLFVAMKLHAAQGALDIDATDSKQVRDAIARGELHLHFAWYAEHRYGMSSTDAGRADRRGGMWVIEGATLGPRIDGNPAVAPLFHAILP